MCSVLERLLTGVRGLSVVLSTCIIMQMPRNTPPSNGRGGRREEEDKVGPFTIAHLVCTTNNLLLQCSIIFATLICLMIADFQVFCLIHAFVKRQNTNMFICYVCRVLESRLHNQISNTQSANQNNSLAFYTDRMLLFLC